MNTTSRAILQTVLTTDTTLSSPERDAVQRLIDGKCEATTLAAHVGDRLLVTQKQVAATLSVSRVTVWRLTRDCVLHPVEIFPGTWRYPWHEVAELAKAGWRGVGVTAEPAAQRAMSA